MRYVLRCAPRQAVVASRRAVPAPRIDHAHHAIRRAAAACASSCCLTVSALACCSDMAPHLAQLRILQRDYRRRSRLNDRQHYHFALE